MAIIECTYFSDVLGMNRTMSVILPQRTLNQIGVSAAAGDGCFPVLYLLHGLSDNHTAWMRNTSIDRYVSPLGLAVVMPCVDRSFYTDMHGGCRYFTHIAEELPRICQGLFNISSERDHTFVAGLSMGGYGAFKLALRCPHKFAAAASLSGALDLRCQNEEDWERVPGERDQIFGGRHDFVESENDLIHLLVQARKNGVKLPKLYQWCGTEDFLYGMNTSFRDAARKHEIDLVYEEAPGDHAWYYWDQQIQRVLDWLPFPESKAKNP